MNYVFGVLLPCNLVVREVSAERTAVDFMDPITVLGLAEDAATNEVAAEARVILDRVVARLGG
ncbi:DUF302 domain-containing protein [uncultured Lamprocystis sp.]|jgi:uncharacterized protein (DUF302 family)|uniref:DUF302 domain-containing protein n=1 Tax=uncultured Lamprocystis sp. TaxID=543132 RepID=UPI0025DF21EA|nr:DUF302 domain-containing protein [uncultured Lamprocystis sp.]